MSKCKQFSLCAVTVAVLSAMCITAAGAADEVPDFNGNYFATMSQSVYNNFHVINTDYPSQNSSVRVWNDNGNLTVNGVMTVEVTRQTEAYKDLPFLTLADQ